MLHVGFSKKDSPNVQSNYHFSVDSTDVNDWLPADVKSVSAQQCAAAKLCLAASAHDRKEENLSIHINNCDSENCAVFERISDTCLGINITGTASTCYGLESSYPAEI